MNLNDLWNRAASVFADNFILVCPKCGSSFATLNYDLVHPTNMSLTFEKMHRTLEVYSHSKITCQYCDETYSPKELKIESLH